MGLRLILRSDPDAAAPAAASGAGAEDLQRLSIAEPDYLLSALFRLPSRLFTTTQGVLTPALPTAFLVGLLAARHRVLEEPSRHLPLLRRVAVFGIAAGWITGAALTLQHLDVLGPGTLAAVNGLHFYTGIFAGVGYAAFFGLLAHRITARGRRDLLPVRALVALGRRSLSGYLAQSLVFPPLLAAWGLGLGVALVELVGCAGGGGHVAGDRGDGPGDGPGRRRHSCAG